MAIELAESNTLGLMEPSRAEQWLDRFLECGCILASNDGTAWIGWGDVEKSSAPDASRLSLFAPDFFLTDPRPWRVYEFGELIGIPELLRMLDATDLTEAPLSWEEPSFEAFSKVFESLKHLIGLGELSKAVPAITRESHQRMSRRARAGAIRHALAISIGSPLMPYGFWTDDEGMIGATPEILFEQTSGRRLETMALAGTRKIDSTNASLLTDTKETYEHCVVVDGIVERLSPFGQVHVGQTEELRLPALIHLHTGISVDASDDFRFDEWVTALHPTPAIGAWPRERGWEWLQMQPDASLRGRFGAPFGVVPPGSGAGRCAVAIRNVQWDAGRTWMMAGSGVVAASRLEREWIELNSKLDSVRGALGI